MYLLQHNNFIYMYCCLTHWGWVTYICVGKLKIIGSDNGLTPGRHQAIIWINAGILLIEPLGTNFRVIYNANIFIQENAFESVICEMADILSWPQCVNACLGIKLEESQISGPAEQKTTTTNMILSSCDLQRMFLQKQDNCKGLA